MGRRAARAGAFGGLVLGALGCAGPDEAPGDAPDAPPPWLVSLQHEVDGDGGRRFRHLCGGALVADDLVLTAAHCVEYFELEGAPVRAVAGDATPLEPTAGARVGRATSYSVHPGRTSPEGARVRAYDAAVVRLEAPLSGPGVAPLAIAPAGSLEALLAEPDPSALFAGWGKADGGDVPGRDLRRLTLRVSGPERAPLYEAVRASWANLLVTVGEEGGNCNFDSGGPLVRAGDEPALLGIASGAATEAASWMFPCKVGAFVRIDAIAPWLSSELRGR